MAFGAVHHPERRAVLPPRRFLANHLGLSASHSPVSPVIPHPSRKTPPPYSPRGRNEASHSLLVPGATIRAQSLPSPVRLTPGLNVRSARGPRAPREGAKAATLSWRPSDAPATPSRGGRAPLPAVAGSRGFPTATSNQRAEHRAAILARGHCACAGRLTKASRDGASGGGASARTQGRKRVRNVSASLWWHPTPARALL